MPTLVVDLNIPSQEYLAMYQGVARNVLARARDGTTIQFPAGSLRRFVTKEGIQGCFRIRFDDNNKLIDVDRIDL